MSDIPNNEDNDWNYLSGILEGSNNDEDLTEDKQASTEPKSTIEVHIKNLTNNDAPLASISHLRPGRVHIHGKFTRATGKYLRRGLHITEAIASDSTGSVRVVWFNQPYLARSINSDVVYELRGSYDIRRGRFQISNARIRPLSEGCAPFERRSAKK